MDFNKLILGLNFNWGKEKKERTTLTQCLNCSAPLDPEQYFCYTCGQKNKTSRVTIWTLMGDLIANIFNLDHSVWKSLFGVFRPAYLTKEFIKGKRKSFLNPLRLFFVTMIVHLALLTSLINTDWANDLANNNMKDIALAEIQTDLNELKDSSDYFSQNDIDSLERYLLHGKNIDDSIRVDVKLYGSFDLANYPLATKDVYNLSRDEILDKYEITDFWERLVVGQYVRALQDLSGAIQFAFGNILWAIVATIFFLSLITKLLYIRKKKYYVEHILLLFNIHSFTFITMSIPIILYKFDESAQSLFNYFFIGTLIYGFWSYKSYYQQGWIKTIIKTMILGFSYMMLMVLCIVVVLLISALVF